MYILQKILEKCKNILKKDRKLQKIYKEDLRITAMIVRCSRIKNREVSFSDLLIMRFLLFMLQELIDMVYFFSFSFIENSPDDEIDNRKLDNELEIEEPVEREPTCQSC